MATLPQLQGLNLSEILPRFERGQQQQRVQQERKALAEFAPAALQGDQDAINSLAAVNPQVALQFSQLAAQRNLAETRGQPKPPTGFTFNDQANPAAGVKPLPGFIEAKSALRRAGAPVVSVKTNIPPGEKEEDKAGGKFFGEQFKTTQEASTTARTTLQNVRRFEQLMERTPTGKVEEVLLGLKQAMVSLNFATQDQVDAVGDMEGIISLATQFSLDFVSQTKGAVSDAEMALFLRAAPNLGNTPQGNQLILDKAEQVANNQIEIARLQRRYRQGKAIVVNGQTFKAPRNGTVEGFQDVVDAFHTANPLFTNQERQQIESGAFVANDDTGQQTQTVDVGATATDGQGNTIVWNGQNWVPQ